MNRFLKHAGIACTALGVYTSCLAYDCNDSETYRNGRRELDLVRQSYTAHLGTAVAFVQRQKGVDFDSALKQVMQTATPSQTRIYDEQLDALGARIKPMKPDSPQACDTLLTLQQQYGDVSRQKIEFIVKLVTGEDSAPR
ncbi:hypothetical protein WL40_02200 [Burkholderia ubonensis]|uniref:Lipoprotein n=1 Tax=Burkholderia ubonensis TaxID=101571 RepID=A0ABD4EC49_9BURK|nr:hypothetical protein [Burkholderia ubonensis]KVM14219.1 hypothetical protein WJ51_14785 [Burkholderia ubonensis]KVM20084.1 hypothetical protein WJ52_06150 [Burkholderia ubonensis]KVM41484.1 hypothetical protein WJ56_33085 [Burkholderia ubonensis]KVN87979.1 hypothetical protein WJ69_16520 [Burkholderia ubonensis]KVN93142.1 hypothetical protein WJ68_31550 [Burkholderia ubonensis]